MNSRINRTTRHAQRPQVPLAEKTLFASYANEASLADLKTWLGTRQFNTFHDGWQDAKGRPGIGLIWNVKGQKDEKAGVIICFDGAEKDTLRVLCEHLGLDYEQEYASQG